MNALTTHYPPVVVDKRHYWLDNEGYKPYVVKEDGAIQIAAVAPLPGSQTAFLNCPYKEALFGGNRGCGKTETLLMDYLKEVGRGFGTAWRGIVFRLEYKDLETVFTKAVRMVKAVFPSAKINYGKGNQKITFAGGETLEFAILAKETDYNNYHGQEFAWIGWEELTQWATDVAYKGMFSVLRSGVVGLPIRVRSTTNPNGAGHNWVKRRFELAGKAGKGTGNIVDIKGINGEVLHQAVAVLGDLSENFVLQRAQPDYLSQIKAAASSQAVYDSWVLGSWDITSGGMFDDLWHDVKQYMQVPRFDIPASWRIDRSFDWGSAKPFSVTWYAQSDGTQVRLPDGKIMHTVRGDVFIIHEWHGNDPTDYNKGLKMSPTDVSKGIVERQINWGIHNSVKPGPADNAINTEDGRESVAALMAKPVNVAGKVYPGVKWTESDKSPGSRKNGWQVIRDRMQATKPQDGLPRERAGLFIFDDCPLFAELIVPLPRSEKDPDDVDTNACDHKADEVRYRLTQKVRTVSYGRTRGV